MNALIIEKFPISAIGVEKILVDNFDNVVAKAIFNSKDVMTSLKTEIFDLIILDINLHETDSQSLITNIKRKQKNAKILIYSDNDDRLYALPFISLGASGFLNKTCTDKDMILAVNLVISGKLYLSQESMTKNYDLNGEHLGSGSVFSKLSSRELEVFKHLICGDRIKDISEIMNIHQSTASTLKKRIMKKVGVSNLMDLKKLSDNYFVA